jgi:hypothetical protein
MFHEIILWPETEITTSHHRSYKIVLPNQSVYRSRQPVAEVTAGDGPQVSGVDRSMGTIERAQRLVQIPFVST